MKYLLTFIVVLSSLSMNAQNAAGVYQIKSDSEEHSSIRTLTLNNDGTFEFHGYDKNHDVIGNKTNYYGKGTWTKEKKVITFSTEASDLDLKYTLDFNNSKARFNSKSPRDKTDRVIANFIVFYETDVFIAQRLKLFQSSTL